jgi:molybdenum cofactor cytidylyltransferase
MSVAAVLLAGGRAQRLGVPKGLITVNGERLLDFQLRRLNQAGVSMVALSLGHNDDAYVDALKAVQKVRVVAVADERSRFGPFGSLVAAIDALQTTDYQHVLVLPIDIPCAKAETIVKLFDVSAEAVVPRHEGKGGHPVLLTRRLAERLRTRDPKSSRLDELLRSLAPGDRIDIDVDDPDILVDFNTMDAVKSYTVT